MARQTNLATARSPEGCRPGGQKPAAPKLEAKAGESRSQVSEVSTCEICCAEFDGARSALPCGHAACPQCLGSWLAVRLHEHLAAPDNIPRCPCQLGEPSAGGCPPVPDAVIQAVDAAMLVKLEQFRALAAARICHELRQCPQEGCAGAGWLPAACVDAECTECGHAWAEPWRAPWLLRMFRSGGAALLGSKEDRETSAWKAKRTKNCESCAAPIEKSGGCPHMKCTSCRYEFCWDCGGPWIGHTVCVQTFEQSVRAFMDWQPWAVLVMVRKRCRPERLQPWTAFPHSKNCAADHLQSCPMSRPWPCCSWAAGSSAKKLTRSRLPHRSLRSRPPAGPDRRPPSASRCELGPSTSIPLAPALCALSA